MYISNSVTLVVNGKEMVFSKEELSGIVAEKINAGIPIEREFAVNPNGINWDIFNEEREDWHQEMTRKKILEAREEVKRNPKRYANPFRTIVPEKRWCSKKVGDMNNIAKAIGDHMADVFEQGLEWAQRITNGETWEDICNKADTMPCYRIIREKDYFRVVGGARMFDKRAASKIDGSKYMDYYTVYCAVPLVVAYIC